MSVSDPPERPPPAVRRRPDERDDRVGHHPFVQTDFKPHPEGGICSWCGNVRVFGEVNVFGQFVTLRTVRWILVLVALAFAASCYAAWRSHGAQSSVDALRVELTHERGD